MSIEKYLFGRDVPDQIKQAIKIELDKRFRTEEELREGEELLRSLAEGLIQGILIHRDFKPLFVNRAYADIFGYTPDEILRMETTLRLVAPYERERFVQYKNARMAGEYAPPRYEYQGVRKDGSFVWLDNREWAIKWRGEPAILTAVLDLAHLRREEELLRSEERFRMLSGAAFEAVVIHDRDRILEVNQAFVRTFGYEPSEIAGKNILELVVPEFRDALYGHIYGGSGERFEAVCLRKDGSTFPAEMSGRTITYQGRTYGALALRDITERKLAEEELRKRQRETAVLAEASRIFNSSLEIQTIFAKVAKLVSEEVGEACAILTVEGEHLRPFTVFVKGEEDKKSFKLLTDNPIPFEGTITGYCVQNKEPVLVADVETDQRFLDSYKQLVNLRSYICVPLMARGEVLGVLSAAILSPSRRFGASDLSLTVALADRAAAALENANLQQQLIQAEKLAAIGDLVSGVAHELNNPLSVILGYSQMMLWGSGEENRKAYEAIIKSVERCRKITNNLLSFARQMKPEKQETSINDCILKVLDAISQNLNAAGIQVELDLDDALPKTLADEVQMQQVFLNIISNAHDAIVEKGAPGVIRISSVQAGADVVITFADNGTGMDDGTLNRAFDPFFTTKEVGQGTGLGLSVAIGIVKSHDGNMQIHSRRGEGTEVIVTIPIV